MWLDSSYYPNTGIDWMQFPFQSMDSNAEPVDYYNNSNPFQSFV